MYLTGLCNTAITPGKYSVANTNMIDGVHSEGMTDSLIHVYLSIEMQAFQPRAYLEQVFINIFRPNYFQK